MSMSRQARWRKRSELNKSKVPNNRAFYSIGIAYLATAALSLITISTILLLGLFEILHKEGPAIMKFTATRTGMIAAGMGVLALGASVCFLKRANLALFACIEVGAAVSLTIEACHRLTPADGFAAFIATLFPAMYLTVTGIENFQNVYAERALQKLARQSALELDYII